MGLYEGVVGSLMASMRLYRFFNKKYALKGIRERRIKISTIDELNDPFEALMFQLPSPSLRKKFEKDRSAFARKYGLLCFSKVWSNALMWSHYADRHRGICLGFEIDQKDLVEVSYTAHRVMNKLPRVKFGTGDATIRKCLGTKYASWSYEQEVRRIESLEDREQDSCGVRYTQFSEGLKLVGVIIGSRLQDSRVEIQDALGDLVGQVELINARLAFTSFWVVRQNNKNLQT
jgi:Protein of unknown function (DUF2971)